MNGIQYNHALLDRRFVILELPAACIAAPDAKHGLRSHLFHLLDYLFQFCGQRLYRPLLRLPSHRLRRAGPRCCTFPIRASLFGIVFAELRATALLSQQRARVIASETSSMFGRSIAVCQPLLYCR